MSDEPKPGYDFFVSPPAAPPQAPPTQPTPALGQTGPNGQQWALNPDTFKSSPGPFRLPRWANIGVTILALLLLGSLAAAIVIPMVERHQLEGEYDNTKIALPKSFNGVTGASSGETEQALKQTATGFLSTSARVYGKDDPLNLVMIIAFRPPQPMNDEQQASERDQLVKQFNTGGTNVPKLSLTAATDVGSLGGYLGCGKSVQSSTICIATDAGSMVAVVLGPSVQTPSAVALKAREATVSRSS